MAHSSIDSVRPRAGAAAAGDAKDVARDMRAEGLDTQLNAQWARVRGRLRTEFGELRLKGGELGVGRRRFAGVLRDKRSQLFVGRIGGNSHRQRGQDLKHQLTIHGSMRCLVTRGTAGRGVGSDFGTAQPGSDKRRHCGAESGSVHEAAGGVPFDESSHAAGLPVDPERRRK